MRLVHEPADGGDRRVVAAEVETADSLVSQARGLMFRRNLPTGHALAFRFDRAKKRDVHMLFVFFPIDVLWAVDGEVRRVERLRPWRGFARAECDLIVELPAGGAGGIEPGDELFLEP